MSENETAKIRVAVVDDHEMFRAGVIATLRDSFDIVGQAADVPGSVAMIAQTKPQVVLLDVHVPGGEGGGGAEILAKSRPYSPTTVFLALSVSDAPQDVGAVIRAGAQGYVTKTITGADLIRCMRAMPCSRQNWPVLCFRPSRVCRRRGLMAALMVRHGLMMRSWTGCPPASRRSCG